MTPDQPPTPDPSGDAELHRSLDDLGRRIGAAKAAADARQGAAAPRRLPVAWLAVALLVAVVAGGLVLAGAGGDDDGEVASSGATTTAAPTTTEAPTTTAAPTTTTTAPPAPTPPPAPGEADPPTGDPAPPSTGATEVTVAAGDSFWRIAERTVSEQLGRPATDAEITGYWAVFVAENADRLVQPGNPDLILPGQVLTLPAGTVRQA